MCCTGSLACLFLREAVLPCSEEQLQALTGRLSRPEAFGVVSGWGPEVFTEIGTLAGRLGARGRSLKGGWVGCV